MIEYVKGDICNATEPLIMHGCNAQGAMNSGVAKALRAKWPKIFPPYYSRCMSMFPMGQYMSLGTYTSVAVGPNKMVINAITQEDYGKDGRKYVSYDALDQVTKRIADDFMGVEAIAMPKIGSGLGGGDWSIIEAIIKANLCPTMQVVVYEGP